MAKPKVNTKCVANSYTGPHERIIEFSSVDDSLPLDGGMHYAGGLISFRVVKGVLRVRVYRCDNVEVVVESGTLLEKWHILVRSGSHAVIRQSYMATSKQHAIEQFMDDPPLLEDATNMLQEQGAEITANTLVITAFK